jgi:Icc-related predicted phosphoesterase
MQTEPLDRPERPLTRFAAVGDIHCTRDAAGSLRGFFAQASEAADALLLCGDLTDYGLPEEARVLVEELSVVAVPIVAVLGNHDFESGAQDEVAHLLGQAGVRVLDGEACEVHGVGIAGVKGFAGGFGAGSLGSWGENAIKQFVNEAIQEALKLESALAKLRTPRRIAVLHYAPIEATVHGEPTQIFPYLGSSRLADPLLRHPVTTVVHGHAHRGTPEGRMLDGTPVYNVAKPLLQRLFPDRPAFRLIDVPKSDGEADDAVDAGAGVHPAGDALHRADAAGHRQHESRDVARAHRRGEEDVRR